MRTITQFTILAAASLSLGAGCVKDTPPAKPPHTNPAVISIQPTVQPAVHLGVASGLAVFAASIVNTGHTSITGDVGLSGGAAMSGFPPGAVFGAKHISNGIAAQSQLDLAAAYKDAAERNSAQIVVLSGNIGGLTLAPGLYRSDASLDISSGDLTLNAMGNLSAVFIIQIDSSLTVAPGRKVILSGGAQASRIFWQVGGSATFGQASAFKGTILAARDITFNTDAALNGRALTPAGKVTMAGNLISNQ